MYSAKKVFKRKEKKNWTMNIEHRTLSYFLFCNIVNWIESGGQECIWNNSELYIKHIDTCWCRHIFNLCCCLSSFLFVSIHFQFCFIRLFIQTMGLTTQKSFIYFRSIYLYEKKMRHQKGINLHKCKFSGCYKVRRLQYSSECNKYDCMSSQHTYKVIIFDLCRVIVEL